MKGSTRKRDDYSRVRSIRKSSSSILDLLGKREKDLWKMVCTSARIAFRSFDDVGCR